jgi:hypothetical protein
LDSRGRKVNIWKCSKETFIGVLRSRTYWYKRLPKSGREKVKLLARDSRGRRKLKDYMDTADGVLLSTIFGFPEMFEKEGYTLSDRIVNSVLMNCFHDYYSFQKKVKSLRKIIRKNFMCGTEIPLDRNEIRSISYWSKPIQILNMKRSQNSKSWMFRVAVMTQTRATGLASSRLMNESVDEFLRDVQVPISFEPNTLLTSCIEKVTDYVASQISLGTNPQFRISMSTSACHESSRKNEGKFGYLKGIVRKEGIKIPPLMEGTPGTLGNPLFSQAISKIACGDSGMKKVNVTAIRENGKARVVTCGSFWKETALQPFSHMTIQAIKKFKNLRSGLQAGRLGWRFIEKIQEVPGDLDGYNWVFDPKIQKYAFSTDWSKATDGPSPEMGRAVIGGLLKKTGLGPTTDLIMDAWVGNKQLYYRGKHVGTQKRGIMMGDPLTKTCLSLAHPICDLYARRKTGAKAIEEGNGDDTTVICSDPAYAEAHAEAAQMLGYSISEDDTMVTRRWGTYCEEYWYIPTSSVNTCRWGTKFRNSLLLPYLDVPKLRTMISTEKDRPDFSSDPRGKVTLLGHDEEYLDYSDPSPLRDIYAIASAFQDVALAAIDQKVPLYLPRQVNGVGKPPPFWSKTSWMNIMSNCTPWHRKYYLTVMDELNRGTGGISEIRGALREQLHFDKEMLVEIYSIPRDNPIFKYLQVESQDWDKYPEGTLDKLIGLGLLVRESKIAKYYLMDQRLRSLEQDLKQDLFEVVKSKMKDYPDISQDNQESIIDDFVETFRDQPFRLHSQRRENLFSWKALEALDHGSALSVTEFDYDFLNKFKKRAPPFTRYEANGETLWQWFEGYKWQLETYGPQKSKRMFVPPRDILEDDPLIFLEVENSSKDVQLIITDDMKLLRSLQRRFQGRIFARMSAQSYLRSHLAMRKEGLMKTHEDLDPFVKAAQLSKFSEQSTLEVQNEYIWDVEIERLFGAKMNCPDLTVKVHRDYGSIEAIENRYVRSEETGCLYQTIGIPWTSNISASNLEKKPLTGFLSGEIAKSMWDMNLPRSIMTEEGYRSLRLLVNDIKSSTE